MRPSKIILLLLQSVVLVESAAVRWTLDKSCYQDQDLQNAILKAVNTAIDRASNGVKQLKLSKIPLLGNKVQKAAALLLGSDYNKMVDNAVAKLNIYSTLQGPLGLTDKKFADSDEWTKLEKDPAHYLDFVIYCAPDVKTIKDEYENVFSYDNARKQTGAISNTLQTMKDETAAGQYKSKISAVTVKDKGYDLDQGGIPKGDRMMVPETITFHPLYLRDKKARAYDLLTDQKLKDATAANAPQIFKEKGATPVDSLLGLEGTMQHEFLHLSAFGSLKDTPEGSGAYGWTNNVNNKNLDNPDLIAYLALIIDLVDKQGYTVDASGTVTKK